MQYKLKLGAIYSNNGELFYAFLNKIDAESYGTLNTIELGIFTLKECSEARRLVDKLSDLMEAADDRSRNAEGQSTNV